MDDFDIFDMDEFMGDDSVAEFESVKASRKGNARRSYEKLMEEKRLRQELENDIGYW